MIINREYSIGPLHLRYTMGELIFDVYAIGWSLDEIASVFEHGWTVHTENLWSFLDLTFVAIFCAYFGVRLHGFTVADPALSKEWGKMASDIISLAAPVLLPRLAFCLMPENMLFISLRAMMADFVFLTVLAAWCFGGFLFAMWWLSESQDGYVPEGIVTIAKWMLWIWFGLDGTGVQRSVEMHWFLGPVLMILFAFLGNTLFLTILVAMLSNTYQNLAQHATEEIQFRRAVLTFEGVKSDAIFAYRPPLNALALVTLLPLKFILSPRWFHKVVRIIPPSFPTQCHTLTPQDRTSPSSASPTPPSSSPSPSTKGGTSGNAPVSSTRPNAKPGSPCGSNSARTATCTPSSTPTRPRT